MEITLDKKSNTEGLIKIKVSEGDYQPHVEEKVKDYARKATIKGFRQGKVPAGVIRKMFGKSILADEINHLLSHKLSDYIKENNLKIIGDPLPNQSKANSIDWDTQKEFEFEYQIGMVEDFKYELSPAVKVKGYEIIIDDKTVNETISDVRKRFGKVSYPEVTEASDQIYGELRTASGDFRKEHGFISIDKVDKKEQKKFIGKQKDEEIEFDLRTAFPSDNDIAQLLGLPEQEAKSSAGNYVIRISTISRTEPAEINQDLFDKVFGKDAVHSEESFVEKVKQTISENYSRETDHFLAHSIEDHFLTNTKVSIPDEFLKTWLKASSNGEVTETILEKEYNDYVRGLKWDLIKNRIAEDHAIKVEAEEVRNKAKDLIMAQFGGQAFAEQLRDRMDAIADNYLSNENGQNFLRLYNQLKGEKIIRHIRNIITVQEQKVSAEEFKKIVQEHKH